MSGTAILVFIVVGLPLARDGHNFAIQSDNSLLWYD